MIDPADPWNNPMTLVIVVVGSEVSEAERHALAGLARDSPGAEPVEAAGHRAGRPGG